MKSRHFFAGFAVLFFLWQVSPSSAAVVLPGNGLELNAPGSLALQVKVGDRAQAIGLQASELRALWVPILARGGVTPIESQAEATLEMVVETDYTGRFFSLLVRVRRVTEYQVKEKNYSREAVFWHRTSLGAYEGQIETIRLAGESILASFLNDYKRANHKVTLSGKVLTYDPRYKFAIINLGKDSGVQAGMVLVATREEEVMATMEVVAVKDEYCVANLQVTPDTKLVQEGDVVEAR